MKKIFAGNTISEKCKLYLERVGYELRLLPPFPRLGNEVCTHADMLLFYDGKSIIVHEEYFFANRGLFDGVGVPIVLSEEYIGRTYPDDVLFNAVLSKDGTLFAKESAVSQLIKDRAVRRVNVRQGYTACSTCKVSERGYITTDRGLCKAYTENGIDALAVRSEGIALSGFDCGFVGGASVVLDDSVCFFGRAEEHPDYEIIKKFVEKHGKKLISLSDEKLTDIGGAVVIK